MHREVCVEQSRSLLLVAGEEVAVRSRVIVTVAWPIYVLSAFALTPAAIIREA